MLFTHVGGIGDLVLVAPLLERFRVAYPQSRVLLAVRADAAFAARRLVNASRVVEFPFNPYLIDDTGAVAAGALQLALDALDEPVDVFVSAELRPTWLTFALAAALQPRFALTLRRIPMSRAVVRALRRRASLGRPKFARYGDGSSNVHELDRYALLAIALGIEPPDRPQIAADPRAFESAMLRRALTAGEYIACFPAGASSMRWARERFVTVLADVATRHRKGVIVLGSRNEMLDCATIAGELRALGIVARAHYGTEVNFEETIALIGNAAAFLGSDTGLAHIAQALDVPGAIVFGGGTFGSYAAWGRGVRGVARPLPCFGCYWDCAFERGVCVEEVDSATVASALAAALETPDDAAQIVEAPPLPERTTDVIARASRAFRHAQADRRARLEAIRSLQYRLNEASEARAVEHTQTTSADAQPRQEKPMIAPQSQTADYEHLQRRVTELTAELEAKQAQIALLKAAADERLLAIEAAAEEQRKLGAQVRHFQDVAQERLAQIDLLRAAADERLAALEALVAEQARWTEQAAVTARTGASDVRLAELERIAEERLALLQRMNDEMNAVRSEAEKRAEILAEMTDVLDAQDREIERLRARR